MGREVIRNGVWESNSSSEHVFIYKHDGEIEDVWKTGFFDKNGKLCLCDKCRGGFDRGPFEVLHTFTDKLAYAICDQIGFYCPYEEKFKEGFKEIEDLVTDIVPGCTGIDVCTEPVECYKDEDGNLINLCDLEWEGRDNSGEEIWTYQDEQGKTHRAEFAGFMRLPDIGGVDHQSSGKLSTFMRKQGITLREFLTDTRYIILIDGDETAIFSTMVELGLINRDKMEYIY